MIDIAKLRVALLFGGPSAEHEMSILSACNVLTALDQTRFEPLPIGIDRTDPWLIELTVDRGRRHAPVRRSTRP